MRKLIGLFVFLTLVGIQICFSQTREVTGTVIDKKDRMPLPGVSIALKSSPGQGTATDMDGKFSLKVKEDEVLVFSFIGMKNVEVPVAGKTVINVEMEANAEMLDEVVIEGMYGTQKLGSITGSVATVKEEKLKDRPVANVADALQGQVAGLQVYTASGEPSAGFSMRLRGVNSMNASNTPLLIIDGTPVTSSAFSALNSNDIENVVLLKDASATAIYGARAANGVLVITTKRGKLGEKPKMQIRAQYGWSQMAVDNLDMMNAQEYLGFRETINPSLKTNAAFQAHKEWATKYKVDTDWKDFLFKSNSPTYQIDGSVTGASEKSNYYFSAGYFNQDGITHHSGLQRMTLRSNVDSKIAPWLKVGVNLGLSHEKYKTTFSTGSNWYNPVNFAKWADPSYSPYTYTYDEHGNIQWGERWLWSDEMGKWNAAYVMEMQPTIKKTTRIMGNTFLQLTPIKGLTIRAQQSADAFDWRSSYKQYPDKQFNGNSGDVQEAFQRFYSFTFTNTAEYKMDVKEDHHLSLLLGQESIIQKNETFNAHTIGHSDNRLMLLSASQTPATSGAFGASLTETVYNSYFARFNYDYRNKYYFDASVRRDGSSLFPEDERWGTFYSLGLMWNVKKESFLENVDVVDDLRLKLSYGSTGNSGIDNYLYIGSIGNGQYNDAAAWWLSGVQNNGLTWETVKSWNVGVSGRLLNALNVDVEFYKKTTTDMLMSVPFSYTTGHSSAYGNVGKMTNTGVDVSVGYDIFHKGAFYWNVSANFNYNKNEIVKLYEGFENFVQGSTGLKYAEGHEFGEFFYAKYAGVNPANGKQLWYTPEGGVTETYSDDLKQFMGKSRFAPWAGGFATSLAWKGISLNADFTWVANKYMWNNDRYFVENPGFAAESNQSKRLLNIWTTPGQKTDVPKVGEQLQMDDRFLEDASFVRLKNLTLSYSFPKQLLKKTGFVEGARVYAVGRNLWTITDYSGYDPEIDSNLSMGKYPNTRQYEFGVELNF
ncbi:MAG: TonB-dependent receptor [Odoribacter sp.]|nr:TonB-dependent receptor [Odoribacter sp.]